jgi:hypothetical protein
MVHLDLSEEESVVLRGLLTVRARDLIHEIHHTASREFRSQLRHEEDVVRQLSERIHVEETATAH